VNDGHASKKNAKKQQVQEKRDNGHVPLGVGTERWGVFKEKCNRAATGERGWPSQGGKREDR